jgi:nucleotide-binding universal stress UspA family protein
MAVTDTRDPATPGPVVTRRERDDWIPPPSDLGPDPELPGVRAQIDQVPSPRHLRTLLVGFDGSEASREAIRWAADMAGPEGRLVVATVATAGGQPTTAARQQPPLQETAWLPLAISADGVAGALLRAAHEHGAEMIVIGGDDDASSEQVARRLVGSSDLPVAVLPCAPSNGRRAT